MKLIKFPEQTVVIAEHQPEYEPLPAFQFADSPEGRLACCWQLTLWERLKIILFTGILWHEVRTFHQPLQPQWLSLEKPFTENDHAAALFAKAQTEAARALQKHLAEKYGEQAERRRKLFDLRNYHPNDRRRTVQVDAADFEAAQLHGFIFLQGCRIIGRPN